MATNRTTQPSEENQDDGDIPPIVVNQFIFLSTIAVIGVFANLIVLVKGIVYQRCLANHNRFAMSTTNFLVMSLAISDLGTSTFSVAVYILPSYVPNFPINEFTCKYIQPFRELFFAISIFSVAFIAVCRYLILYKVFQKNAFLSSNIANNIVLWIMCYLIFALPFSAIYKVEFTDGALNCAPIYYTPMGQKFHRTFIVMVNVFLPALMVSLSYIGIIRRLRRVRMVVVPEEAARIKKAEIPIGLIVQSHRIVKISFLLLIAYWVTFIPYSFLIIAIEYGDLNAISFPELEDLAAIATCLLYSVAAINPLILMFSSDVYRPKLATIWYFFACWVSVPQGSRLKPTPNIKDLNR